MNGITISNTSFLKQARVSITEVAVIAIYTRTEFASVLKYANTSTA